MDRIKRLRKIIVLLIVLFVFGLVLLTMMIPMKSFISWIVIGTQAVVILYFAALSFGLVKELESHENDNAGQ